MRVLHAGCGHEPLPAFFSDADEVRLDADPSVNPHVVASMTALGDIGEFDVVYCSHAVEHLLPDDAMTALREFRRVLKDGGYALVIVPDCQGIEPTFDNLPGMNVSGHELLYGKLDTSNPFMQHKTGFIASTLEAALRQAGFKATTKRGNDYNLIGVGVK